MCCRFSNVRRGLSPRYVSRCWSMVASSLSLMRSLEYRFGGSRCSSGLSSRSSTIYDGRDTMSGRFSPRLGSWISLIFSLSFSTRSLSLPYGSTYLTTRFGYRGGSTMLAIFSVHLTN